MNLQKLLSLRDGHKSVINHHLEKIFDAKDNGRLREFNAILAVLEEKVALLYGLNEKVLNQTEADGVGEEMMATGDYSLDLEIKMSELREFRNRSEPISEGGATPPLCSTSSDHTNGIALQSRNQTVSNLSNSSSSSSQFHRLPKLALPRFDGDILTWQTFWDSFESTVHYNVSLTDVQKFSYLKSQLECEAARTIEGFALTSANYLRAVDLLRERYGQVHKITHVTMQAMLKLPAPVNNLQSLRHFCDKMESYIRSLEAIGQFEESYGSLLVPVILDKLPAELKRQIAREHGDSNWKLTDLRHALKKELRIMEVGASGHLPEVEDYNATASFFTRAKPMKNQTTFTRKTNNHTKGSLKCAYCKEEHVATECRKYADAEARIEVIKQEKLCFNCLGKHQVAQCKSTKRCKKCHKKHHSSICQTLRESERETRTQRPETTSNLNPEAAVFHSSLKQNALTTVLLKTAIATVSSHNTYTTASVLFDEGAQRSFITKKLADELQLAPETTETLHLSAFGGDSSKVQHLESTTVHILTENNLKIPIRVLIVPRIATPMSNHVTEAVDRYLYLRKLKLAHPASSDHQFNISILIGADHYWDIVEDEIIRGKGPTAMKSKLGYLLSGPLPDAARTETTEYILNVITSPASIEKALEKFWTIENEGISSCHGVSAPEEYLQQYQRSSIEFRDGKYYAKLPWKHDHPELPSNYEITRKRTESTIRRLQKEPETLRHYGKIITEQLERGFIEKVPEEDQIPVTRVHYIPHHPVKKDSSTTPVRIVYDCSCRQFPNQASLNDCLESAPPVLNDLTKLLVRFRLHDVAVSTDIEKAFLHVGLHEDDRNVTRFLWLQDPNHPDSPLITYRFRSVLFGAKCSPFILNAVLLKHLDRMKDVMASKIIQRDIYVDNVISSFPTETEAVKFFEQARSLMSKASMNLRSWTSNNATLRQKAAKIGVLETDEVAKVLGLRWIPENDTLTFVKRNIPAIPDVTKRTILKYSSQIYDPLGLLSPVTIRAKLLLQELWKMNFDWDVPVPHEIQEIWSRLSDDLMSATNITIPRKFSIETGSETCLHVFADASTKAYGAVAYLCDGENSNLVMAKTRVAPLKTLTLPQLELMAALIAARLTRHLQQTLKVTMVTLWSDSQIVLQWLNSAKPLKRFVHNRVNEIVELTALHQWRYCPTYDNPADLFTRGTTADNLLKNELWIKGPNWLNDRSKWPIWKRHYINTGDTLGEQTTTTCSDEYPDETEKQTSPTAVLLTNQTTSDDSLQNVITVEKYSSYRKLLRVTAFVLRFVHNLRNAKADRKSGYLSAHEIFKAEKLLIRSCQTEVFLDEINCIKSDKSSATLVKQLRLFLDKDSLIRCGGRLHNAPITEDAKFPYLLSKTHPLTKLIVQDAHATHLHSGVNSTISYIRQKFWIPAIRQCVNAVIRKCVTCRKVIGKSYSAPDPPPLPKSRVQDSPPFSVTGVDFAGPLNVKSSTGSNQKAYICLFTCATTRAVHLEVVCDLSTDTFLQAFRRFISRKSLPSMMISDNATTFTSAALYLKRLYDTHPVREELNNKGIEWKFIPKRAPWFGGFWERIIGLMKTTLKKVLGKAYVTIEILQTVITEIEAILNDRPLTSVSTSIDDLEPLTPAHLLYGRRILSFPLSVGASETVDDSRNQQHVITKRAKQVRHMIDQYWTRWRREYLTALREQHRKTGSNNQTIRVGDIVQVHEDGPRERWQLAIVEELLTGNDGLHRAAKIRTCRGYTNRPIVKLYPLEILHQKTSDS